MGMDVLQMPYQYPSEPHRHRHGPAGYSDYRTYRPWLEDEFAFRCIYCLKRQTWARTDIWVVDHLIPQERAPELACVYENLVLACQHCNLRKLNHIVPDPRKIAYGSCLQVEDNGTVTDLNKSGARLVKTLRLNHPGLVGERLQKIGVVRALAANSQTTLLRNLLGFPDSLPDLAMLRPSSNRRPHGIAESWHTIKAQGNLPIYMD